jgi:phosphoribosylformylglycinamidine cyclo-ligase
MTKGKATYSDAGVDLDVYRDSMSRLPKLLHRTFSPRVLKLDGGFAGLFQLDFPNKLFARQYQHPVLVSCADGVGTKLNVACLADVHRTIGIDLVAMSVNDAICCGAEPLFFLDYVAMSHDDPVRLEQIVEGISEGCCAADCALLGGETAIMPGLYQSGDYDLAGFCVGVVEKEDLIDGRAITNGDKVIGLASSGLHSNGFSLVRKIVFDLAGLTVDDEIEELQSTVGSALLQPTRIYVRPLRAVSDHYTVKTIIHGIAHITGGGLHENLERILPDGVHATIDRGSWDVPGIFPWLQCLGDVADDEMDRVFNMGIGMTLVVSPYFAASVQQILQDNGVPAWEIGEIVAGERGVSWR